MPPDTLQLSVVAVALDEGLGVADAVAVAAALADEGRAADAARGAAVAAAGVADGAAFAFAAAFGVRLACGLAGAEATARPAVLAARIMLDAAESTPTPPCFAPLRLTGRLMSVESWAACG
jgi:hypothetical protein